MQKVPMTPRGQKLLQDRLDQLKKVERPQNVKDIETAREHGDLSENAEYKYAKSRQSEIAGQIRYTETQLALAEVIDPASLDGETIRFGATVLLVDVSTDVETTYMIVGEDEADIKSGLLSITSPLAKALIGKEPGDTASFTAPGGKRSYEVLDVMYSRDVPSE
jgi:transcription elongation factor GreA